MKKPKKVDMILCACGCGETRSARGSDRHKRKYISGHHQKFVKRKSPVTDAILGRLAQGQATTRELIELSGAGHRTVKTMLCQLRDKGKIVHVSYGHWDGNHQ